MIIDLMEQKPFDVLNQNVTFIPNFKKSQREEVLLKIQCVKPEDHCRRIQFLKTVIDHI